MNEAAARRVLLLQAFETAAPASPHWSAADQAWASRLALADGGTQAPPDRFIAERARHALQRLAAREPALAQWNAQRLWRVQWVGVIVLIAFVIGVAADSIGSGQRINLLAPPVWALVAWNLAVYALLLVHALAPLFRRRTPRIRPLLRLMQRLLASGRGRPALAGARLWAGAAKREAAGRSAAIAQAFAYGWLRHSAPLSTARATTLLHAGSAGLAVGLIAGMYLRGLVLDYRAVWESTFLDAGSAHALVAALLAPAAALSGIALPDTATFAALRVAHGSAAAGAPAAPWIHLFALTLLLWIVLPRSLLALWSGWRAHRLARRFPLPLDTPYFQRLRPAAARRHRAHRACGRTRRRRARRPRSGCTRCWRGRSATPCSCRSRRPRRSAPKTTRSRRRRPRPRWWSCCSTSRRRPRPRTRAASRSVWPRAAPAVIVLVDEAAFARRFGSASDRLAERRAAWRQLAESLGSVPVFADLETPDLDAAERALQAALGSPVHAATEERA